MPWDYHVWMLGFCLPKSSILDLDAAAPGELVDYAQIR